MTALIDNVSKSVFVYTRKGRPAVQDDVSGLQLAFVVKHHGVDPSYRVVLDHTYKKIVKLVINIKIVYVCYFCPFLTHWKLQTV